MKCFDESAQAIEQQKDLLEKYSELQYYGIGHQKMTKWIHNNLWSQIVQPGLREILEMTEDLWVVNSGQNLRGIQTTWQ